MNKVLPTIRRVVPGAGLDAWPDLSEFDMNRSPPG